MVPPPPNVNLIGSRWVFKIKRLPDGSFDQCKAQLVAKGFHQVLGVDFHETFSPVVKAPTIRIILAKAVAKGWLVRQLDINNAFLNGYLTRDVFMKQPDGFVDSSQPTYVCKLDKVLYGLK